MAASIATLAALISCDSGSVDAYAGNTFYVDPVSGSMTNDGSVARPWSSLQEVLDGAFVETTAYSSYPYYEADRMRVVNDGAPVKPGDTIVLAGGDYGELHIYDMYNLREITIRAADGEMPRFSRVHVRAASGWRLSGLTIDMSLAAAPTQDSLLAIESHGWRGPCRDIVVESCSLSSDSDADPRSLTAAQWNALACSGISANGDRITLDGNRLSTVNFGITVMGNDCLVRGNAIDGFCGDGMRGLGDDLVFEYNTVENCYVVNDNHCDGFQSWADIDTGDPPERVTLRGNRIFQWTGERPALSEYLQGIGLFDGPYVDWRIENNLVVTDMYHGISVYHGIDCVVVNNTVVDEQAAPSYYDDDGTPHYMAPWIMVTDDKDGTASSGCVVRNNVAPSVTAGSGCAADHNYEAAIGEYASLFVSPDDLDFRLLPGTALVDSGYYALAPAFDVEGKLRPRGGGYDLGAFER